MPDGFVPRQRSNASRVAVAAARPFASEFFVGRVVQASPHDY